MPIDFDSEGSPDLAFRIDNFHVPEAARARFEAQMGENLALVATLPGFRGHYVFERIDGPTRFNVATIAIWENVAALREATTRVRAHYERIGFDGPAMFAELGIEAELGNFQTRRDDLATGES